MDPAIYGLPESSITEAHITGQLNGLTLQQVTSVWWTLEARKTDTMRRKGDMPLAQRKGAIKLTLLHGVAAAAKIRPFLQASV
jgi:hypothetical protein